MPGEIRIVRRNRLAAGEVFGLQRLAVSGQDELGFGCGGLGTLA